MIVQASGARGVSTPARQLERETLTPDPSEDADVWLEKTTEKGGQQVRDGAAEQQRAGEHRHRGQEGPNGSKLHPRRGWGRRQRARVSRPPH